MILESVKIKNYKNISGSYSFTSRINLIIGNNGTGKTNLLEIINYIPTKSSFLHSNERLVFPWNTKSTFTKIEASLTSPIEKRKLELSYVITENNGRIQKNFFINNTKTPKGKVIPDYHTIFFKPQDMDFMSRSPGIRRDEIDNFIKIIHPTYKTLLRNYKKIITQRNKLLKRIFERKSTKKELQFWNDKLIEYGSIIIQKRLQVLKEFSPHIETFGNKIFKKFLKDSYLKYISKIASEEDSINDIKTNFKNKLQNGEFKEIVSKTTLYGPQRDDILFFSNNKNLHEVCSRGEQRLISLILKLSMWGYIKKLQNIKHPILLDDFTSELDTRYIGKIEEILENLETQIFITDTSKNNLSEDFTKKAKIISTS